ncbi:hypothetical protein [Streptomyces purpurascens]|uniref:hypothetical protein n=1 Tax=Streptomyces purpurascens TaxID=1924 RepID=UPI001676BB23|nr:hypothetical protein [Streptomyces purpurascens]MCE7049532.1 hypothetical protein [Streptomyces purpurascens]GHA22373.1 hypothetical protein GCM10010303_36110 [Streptomyces purpurascens]
MTTTTAATNLRTIALHWTDLHEAAGTPSQIGAFGLGLRGYLARLDQADAERAAMDAALDRLAERADSNPEALGERPVPVRLHILDTMRVVEATLVQCADDIAATAQRAPIPMPTARKADYRTLREANIAAADRRRKAELALADQHDPKRWRYTGRRTAPHAALWLLARVERTPGPCRRITEQEEQRIGTVAAGAADRVERALDIASQKRTLEQLHDCGGRIDIHGGEGRTPVGHCTGCGAIWTEGGVIAA